MATSPSLDLRLLTEANEMQAVEALQAKVWQGAKVVPAHLLVAIAHSGGIIMGAFHEESLIAFVFSFPGIDPATNKIKQSSHMLAVDPEFRNKGIGFALKRAQWQMARKKKIDLVTWTFDPLMSQNAYLNIVKLGAIAKSYVRDVYGQLADGLNEGIATDRFLAELWVHSSRVGQRLGKQTRGHLALEDFKSAGAKLINSTELNNEAWPIPHEDFARFEVEELEPPPLALIEIPSDFLALKEANMNLAIKWRQHTRQLFEYIFDLGYIVTDFSHTGGEHPRSFYVLSNGEATLGM